MNGVNYVTNDKGEKTALLIDLTRLRNTENAKMDLTEFLEDLDDMIAAELTIGQKGRPYQDVRKDILNG
jgi:hypothetical protein